MAEKILVLGATGALGKYMVPLLAQKGFKVDSVALDDSIFRHPGINHIKGDARDILFRNELFKNNYDGIVDFMVYNSADLASMLMPVVNAAGHYIFVSSYRVYDGVETPTRENSPRLLDNTKDVLFQNSDDYSIYKARGENVLNSLLRKNWTIVRLAITYSLMRYQLVTLEAPCTVGRAQLNKPVILPGSARNIQATMSWAGDVAQMISRLLFNGKALGETFTVSTSEHPTWEEIAGFYQDICNLKTIWVDQEDYLRCVVSNYELSPYTGRWQLIYDRLLNRVMDNSKVLGATGLKQENMMKLYDGLKYEISRTPKDFGQSVAGNPTNRSIDKYLADKGIS